MKLKETRYVYLIKEEYTMVCFSETYISELFGNIYHIKASVIKIPRMLFDKCLNKLCMTQE